MNDLNNQTHDSLETKSSSITPREILMKYLPFLPWVIASVLGCLLFAFIKLRYSPNIYNVTSTILIKDPSSNALKSDKLDAMLFSQPNRNLNDEIQLIRSRSMGKRVARSLDLKIQYFNQGKIISTQISASESPFTVTILSIKDSAIDFTIPVHVISDKEFILNETEPSILFNQPFEINEGRFILEKNYNSFSTFASPDFFITYATIEQRGRELVGNLSATQSGESNNILQLTYETENTGLGVDIVNQWMKEYQQAGLEDQRQIAVNALRFIDDQMDTVKFELGGVEKNLQGYRERNHVFNPEQQSRNFFSTLSELEKTITEQGVKIEVVDNLISYINDNRNPYRKVGSTLGIEEPSLAMQIGQFNNLQVQRETLLKTTTSANPMVADLEAAIEKLRVDILQNLRNVRAAYKVSIDNLTLKNNEAGREVSLIPAKEKQLLDITRRQKILEELFSYLLQKKLETSISSASTISNAKVIEPAIPSNLPVKPNRKGTYVMAFFLGLLIPSIFIFLLEYLNDKVNSRGDIQKATMASIIGEVGHSEEKETLVVSRTSRRFIAEQFRIIRTNMQYVLPKQDKMVILVTSSSSGEGKSFISTNIGAVMALAGKKTAILEFDIRKPKIMASLGLPKKTGITNYIIGKSSFEELAVTVSGTENLYVIPCGPVPPNPAELLLDKRLEELIEKVKLNFDIVIIDTAPVGLVSDAIMLGKYADASLYIIRHNYTYKKQLQLLNDIYSSHRLPKISLVVNDIKADGGYGRYYGYGGYGYTGYGYGYGSEYFEEKSDKKGFIKKLTGMFKKS